MYFKKTLREVSSQIQFVSQDMLVLLPLLCIFETLGLSLSTCSAEVEPQGVEHKVAGHRVVRLDVGVACGEVKRKGRRLSEVHAS